MPIAKGICTQPVISRSRGVQKRCSGCGDRTPTIWRPPKMKTSPIRPMMAEAMTVQMMIARRARRGLPAPRYCPARDAAAMPMAKPGWKLKASTRTARM